MEAIMSSKILSSRRGSLAIAGAAATLAALVLLVYLNQYRNSVSSSAAPAPVLVAKRLITKGTPASVLATESAFALTTVPEGHVKDGAVADPDALRGHVALRDVYPGQQLTLADFTATASNALPARLTKNERALAVPVDPQHGLVGRLEAGNKVDVYVSIEHNDTNVVSLVRADVTVLEAPASAEGGGIGGGGGNQANYVLKVPTSDAARFAYAADYGKIWIVARPSANIVPTRAAVVTIQGLIAGQRGG